MSAKMDIPAYRQHRRPAVRAAFTLVEVLVVVAIIALLLAILIPSLKKARAQARRTMCMSNLKQITLAWHQYLDANDGNFYRPRKPNPAEPATNPLDKNPNYNYGGIQGAGSPQFGIDPNDPNYSIPKPLNTYLQLPTVAYKNADVFRCPADTGTDTEQPTVFDYYGTSYPTNIFLVGSGSLSLIPSDPCVFMKIKVAQRVKDAPPNRSKIANESKLLLMGDFGWVMASNINDSRRFEWHDRKSFHNMAFLDGHADFVHVRKGLYVTSEYTLIPFQSLQEEAAECQVEGGL